MLNQKCYKCRSWDIYFYRYPSPSNGERYQITGVSWLQYGIRKGFQGRPQWAVPHFLEYYSMFWYGTMAQLPKGMSRAL